MALSYLDRTVLSLLVLPIQADLRLSDTDMGILLGPAFVLLYALTGIPLGYLVDRWNRRNILICGMLVWTAGTFVSGLSRSFEALLFGRAIVGMGEASVVPCVFSIVADCFPPEKRGRATGAVSTGVSIGAGVALFGGGLMLRLAAQINHLSWPVVGALHPWQLVFIGYGLPGLVVLMLLLTVPVPARHNATRTPHDASARPFFDFLRKNPAIIIGVLTAYILFTLIQYALTSWTPTMLTRRLHLSVADAALTYGWINVTVAPLSAIAGGFLGDAMSKRWPDGRLRMAAFIAPIFVPGTLLATLAPNLGLVVFGMCLISLSGCIIGTSVYATIQEMSPNHCRGRMLALYALTAGLLGMMLGAPLVAFMTDHVFGDPAALNLSMLAVSAPGAMIALALFWWALPGFGLMRARAQTKSK
jgi:MFS family permease